MSEENRIHIQNLTPGDIALLKDIAEAAAEKTAAKMLALMGLEVTDPIASQELFTALRSLADRQSDPEQSKDQEWTRRTRQRSEGMTGKALLTAVGLVVVGAAHTLWIGVKAIMPGGH